MSILIKGLKMSKTCVGCVLDRGGYCEGFEIPRAIKFKTDHITRMDWCPLVELPTQHGRLIDGDSLTSAWRYVSKLEQNYKASPLNWSSAYSTFADLLDCAPAIIEEEEAEE